MDRGANFRAAFVAFAVCAAASVGFVYFWYEVKLPFLRTQEFFLGLVAASIALLTIIVFQSFRVSVTASALAQDMAENMLIYSRELFTELYRGSPVPYFVITHDLTIESANLAAVRLFGVEQGWLEGKDILEYLQSENEQRVPLIRQYFRKSVFVNNEEVTVVRPDGQIRTVMLSLFSFKDSNHVHKGLLTLFDITKQKEVDKAKTEFVSLASHQLRTPITALKWNIELLEAGGAGHFTDVEKEEMGKISRAVNRMDTLVSDFLSVSKLELGTLQAHMETLSLDTFLTGILESFEGKAATRHITIERDWNTEDTLEADPHLLEMAMSNLISNAIKYTPENGHVHIHSHTEAGHRVISVSDTGMGIPPDEQEHIFSKIFRASNAKAEVAEGTGLGLYIAREAVRVMGGEVTFVSTVGEGTTFTVLLPALT
jgi:PAS domain S-box-containing protein